MGTHVSKTTEKILRAIHAQGSMSVSEVRAFMTDPEMNFKARMADLAQNLFILGEPEKNAGKQFALTNRGRVAIGLEPLAMHMHCGPSVAQPRTFNFKTLPEHKPDPWPVARGAPALRFLSIRSIGNAG